MFLWPLSEAEAAAVEDVVELKANPTQCLDRYSCTPALSDSGKKTQITCKIQFCTGKYIQTQTEIEH